MEEDLQQYLSISLGSHDLQFVTAVVLSRRTLMSCFQVLDQHVYPPVLILDPSIERSFMQEDALPFHEQLPTHRLVLKSEI